MFNINYPDLPITMDNGKIYWIFNSHCQSVFLLIHSIYVVMCTFFYADIHSYYICTSLRINYAHRNSSIYLLLFMYLFFFFSLMTPFYLYNIYSFHFAFLMHAYVMPISHADKFIYVHITKFI